MILPHFTTLPAEVRTTAITAIANAAARLPAGTYTTEGLGRIARVAPEYVTAAVDAGVPGCTPMGTECVVVG